MPEWPTKVRELVESCSSKRMITSVLALLVFCVLIVMIEEIAEENVTKGEKDVLKASEGSRTPPIDSKIDEMCWEREPVEVLQACIPCNEFETKAIKSKHCASTGHFDRLRCTDSGAVGFRPCTPGPSRHSLVVFFIVSLLVAASSGFVAVQRKAHLDRHAYTRLSQNIN